MTENPHLAPARQPDDADAALLPKTLAEFVGQAAKRPSALPSTAKGFIQGA